MKDAEYVESTPQSFLNNIQNSTDRTLHNVLFLSKSFTAFLTLICTTHILGEGMRGKLVRYLPSRISCTVGEREFNHDHGTVG